MEVIIISCLLVHFSHKKYVSPGKKKKRHKTEFKQTTINKDILEKHKERNEVEYEQSVSLKYLNASSLSEIKKMSLAAPKVKRKRERAF